MVSHGIIKEERERKEGEREKERERKIEKKVCVGGEGRMRGEGRE